jgi:hypothetical protein
MPQAPDNDTLPERFKDTFEEAALPSGTVVYIKKTDAESEYYYCPICLRQGRIATLEFKFGAEKQYECSRCHSIFHADKPLVETPTAPRLRTGTTPPASTARNAAQENTTAEPAQATIRPHPQEASRRPLPTGNPNRIKILTFKEIFWKRFWRRFGRGSFAISLFVHAVLAILAAVWVVSTHAPSAQNKNKITTFGMSGGSMSAQEHRVQLKKSREMMRDIPKLAVQRSDSRVRIAEQVPMPVRSIFSNSSQTGGPSNTRHLGTGIGNERFYTGRNVMGLRIHGNKIAVYLDNSGSMTPYLERVKDAILKQYPKADIFEYDGIRVTVQDNKVLKGRHEMKIQSPLTRRVSTSSGRDRNATKKSNKDLIKEKYGWNFEQGSVGAWVDIMLFEGYEALVIFSDFQDGVRQTTEGRGEILREDDKDFYDRRLDEDKAWEQEWIRQFSNRASGPRLYLFSIEVPPQTLWQRCVEASGGAVRMRPELR